MQRLINLFRQLFATYQEVFLQEEFIYSILIGP